MYGVLFCTVLYCTVLEVVDWGRRLGSSTGGVIDEAEKGSGISYRLPFAYNVAACQDVRTRTVGGNWMGRSRRLGSAYQAPGAARLVV